MEIDDIKKQRKPCRSYTGIMFGGQSVWSKLLGSSSREESLGQTDWETSSQCEEQKWTTWERKSHIGSETNFHFCHCPRC